MLISSLRPGWRCALAALATTLSIITFSTVEPAAGQFVPVSVPAVSPRDRDGVLELYHNYFLASENVSPGWTGSVAAGVPGTLDAEYLAATLRRINYYRAMSGVPGNVALDPEANGACQQAALMMVAARSVSHQPPPTWPFYTPAAALAAEHSNLALDSRRDAGPGAIDRYMADDGSNNSVVGHRRWLLFAGATFMAVGAVPPEPGHPGANATWVRGVGPGALPGVRPSIAWPPAGYVPAPLLCRRWSFSYPDADFSRATVRVTKRGVPVSVALLPLGCEGQTDGSGLALGNNTVVWTLPGNVVDPSDDEPYEIRVIRVLIAGTPRDFAYPVTSIPVVFRAEPIGGSALPAVIDYTFGRNR